MFKLFGKKKIKEDIVANIFVNSILNTIDKGFPEIVGIINDSPEFSVSPELHVNDDDQFILIVFAVNLYYLPDHLHNNRDIRIENLILSKLSKVFDCDSNELEKVIQEYKCYLMKVIHPSKNMKYAMSRGIFGKYQLNEFQVSYFKNMKSPNPMLLKRMDEALNNFIWNWDAFTEKYQIT
jgi:hypothetical protein